jgi:hypothetical protein
MVFYSRRRFRECELSCVYGSAIEWGQDRILARFIGSGDHRFVQMHVKH